MASSNYDKLIDTLKEVFMLDKAELDFGIYRIMNQKRKDIEQFLEKDLVPQVKLILAENISIDKQALQKELEEAIAAARTLGADPDTLHKVQQIKLRLGEAANLVGLENEVFSLLANFFKRYYDSGDFVSMRRYKKDVYAIPYEGEEVKLHWANADQYYIKTSEYFKNYRFNLRNGKRVTFELIDASTEQNNNKTQNGKERRFAIHKNKPVEITVEELKIYFTYETTEKKVKQEDLLDEAFEVVKPHIKDDFLLALEVRPTPKDETRTLLQKHFRDYTARNTFDYFIHKDLYGFLTRELDFYIKNEVLFIDDINTRNEKEFLKNLSKIKTIKGIGEKIITFLAQLENFQKKLWLKRKFVVETNYCITLDRVPEEFYPEIVKNEKQIEEWINLFTIDQIKANASADIFGKEVIGYENDLSIDFLRQNQFLLVDTFFYTDEFKYRLISCLDDFESKLDGLLIKSDNFQGINTIANRIFGTVNYCYYDPPYNTSEFGFVYKNNYKHSSWLSMMFDRLSLSKRALTRDGVIGVAIDDTELSNIRLLLNDLFGLSNFLGTIAVEVNPAGQNIRPNVPARSHDYLVLFERNFGESILLTRELTDEEKAAYELEDKKGKYVWDNLRRRGGNSRPTDRPNQWFPIYMNVSKRILSIENFEGGEEVWPIDPKGEKRIWRVNPITARKEIESGEISILEKAGRFEIVKKSRMPIGKKPKTLWDDSKYSGTTHGTKLLSSILGGNLFSYPKSIYLVEDSLRYYLNDDGTVLDIFAGSGTTAHAVINLNREDGGSRKYILIEMAEYFDTATKPRVQKIIYSKDWKDGKPVSRDGVSHCFKYIRLESYEDTLNNLVFKQDKNLLSALQSNPTFKEDYMLSYMLDVEAEESLLNLEWFKDPFNCHLNITRNNEIQPTRVDMVETFNYLIGLVVESYAAPKKGFVVVTGKTLTEDKILVVWRDCYQYDNKSLNEFLQKSKYNPLEREFDRIYVNGDNNLENLKVGEEKWKVGLIEEEFKKRMFNETS
jgi:adenine-specific DNA-methyltransferase